MIDFSPQISVEDDINVDETTETSEEMSLADIASSLQEREPEEERANEEDVTFPPVTSKMALATDVRPGCKTQGIAPTLPQVIDLVCASTKEREYFKTCIVGHVNCCLQCGPTLSMAIMRVIIGCVGDDDSDEFCDGDDDECDSGYDVEGFDDDYGYTFIVH
ncbi:hypothetical protein PoB_000489700 [Plakobranchus ocellatus]|uniref:Uncharacterized protein n=1 Tax=Plakobranchus ocellatus TaxID=259542 RepID=A0AAV3Y6G6_9GAST|nr:hypothetical protein PoB_000489700 [Plakobranchus ocellatus]